jgi:lipid-binding SYLF domain-containing protein
MGTHMSKQKIISLLLLNFVFIYTSFAQIGGWKPELEKDAKEALTQMITDNPKLETFKEKAYGYAVYPKVTKVGLAIGGAAGQGIVYKNHEVAGASKLKQASFGLQAGGQQYSEVIFFENMAAYDKFTSGNLKFDAQASAVAITEGASADLAYSNGVAVFTRVKGGLMYEASIGGQHFTFDPNNQ